MGFFILFFLAPYGLILCMPGKKTYLSLSILYICLVIYIFDWLDEMQLDLLGPLPYLFICMGAIWGIVTAGLVLLMKRTRALSNWVMLARIVMPLTFLLFIEAAIKLDEWGRREPSSECAYDAISLQISSSSFTVPGSAITSFKAVRQDIYGKKNTNRGKYWFSFWRNEQIRKYCSRSDQGSTTLNVEYIKLDFNASLSSKNRERHKHLCSYAHLPKSICEFGKYRIKIPLMFPTNLRLFSEGEHRIYNRKVSFFPKILNWTKNASLVNGRTDLFYNEKTKSYYLLTEDELGIPVAFRCGEASGGLAYCNSQEEIYEGVYLEYVFNLGPTLVTSDALRGRYNTLKLIEELRLWGQIKPTPI